MFTGKHAHELATVRSLSVLRWDNEVTPRLLLRVCSRSVAVTFTVMTRLPRLPPPPPPSVNLLEDAARLAFEQRDRDALAHVEALCGPNNRAVLQQITQYRQTIKP